MEEKDIRQTCEQIISWGVTSLKYSSWSFGTVNSLQNCDRKNRFHNCRPKQLIVTRLSWCIPDLFSHHHYYHYYLIKFSSTDAQDQISRLLELFTSSSFNVFHDWIIELQFIHINMQCKGHVRSKLSLYQELYDLPEFSRVIDAGQDIKVIFCQSEGINEHEFYCLEQKRKPIRCGILWLYMDQKHAKWPKYAKFLAP